VRSRRVEPDEFFTTAHHQQPTMSLTSRSTKVANLFEPVQLGSLVLANRVFMAPLTRNRADADGVPGELAATYYAQRASAGLIVTEATQISLMGKG
jgi:N-ethylmaleimide reductase